ncbi:MAG: diguanylate cyclase [Xanthobacteraceae bacterium]
MAERVRRNFVAAAARFGREQFLPSVSVGIALGRESGVAVGALLSVADRALYRAKELGRNRVEMEMQDGEAAASAPSIVPIIGANVQCPVRIRAADVGAPHCDFRSNSADNFLRSNFPLLFVKTFLI